MPRTELHASWLDGETFRALWAPLDASDEFLLISCYVSGPALEVLESTLRAHLKRPSFRCTLVFSLVGIAATSRRELIDRLFLLVTEQPSPDRVQIFLINDPGAALFHPKAHGSRAGQRTKVVVGSANLTMAAQQRNYELMAVIEGDPEAYQALRRAVDSLVAANHVRVDRTTIDPLRNSTAIETLTERAAPRQTGESKRQHAILSVPKRDYSSLLSSSPDYHEAWLNVRALLGSGGYVARIDQLDPLVVSIPLSSFRDAGLLAAARTQEVGTGVSYENGGGSITVSLIPNELRKELMLLTKPLGRLLGRFSIELLGARWMPLAWDEQFRQHWEAIASTGVLAEAEHAVEKHVKHLTRELGQSGKLRRRLGQQLEVLRPAHWAQDKVPRLLGWRAERPWPEKLTEKLKQEVVEAILVHVTTTVLRRLSPEFAIAQLRQVGRPPLLRQVPLESITVVDALFLLSDWTMAGVLPRLRSASGDLTKAPGRGGVSQMLAQAFDRQKANAQTVFEAALRWQNVACDADADEQVIFETLTEAWTSFVGWYGFTPGRAEWGRNIPAWTSRGAQDDEDPPSVPRAAELASFDA